MKLTEAEIKRRRENIIMTAFHLFCERGIVDVTLLEIARASHVGETTMYRYFGTKTQLVLEAFVMLWDSIMSSVQESVENQEAYHALTGYEQISVWLDAFRQLYQNHADFILFSYEAKLYLLRNHINLNQSQQDVLMHAIKEPCIAALYKGMEDGTIPITDPPEDVFFALWGAVRGYIVKIVVYDALYGENSPWESRYTIMENGVLAALRAGWRVR